MINELLLKQIAILGVIAGGALGFLSLIPYINIFSITILFEIKKVVFLQRLVEKEDIRYNEKRNSPLFK